MNSGAAAAISNDVTALFQPLGAFGILMGLFLVTALLASLVGPVPAVTLMFPLALRLPTASVDPTTHNTVRDERLSLRVA